jgi:hypothetical protein
MHVGAHRTLAGILTGVCSCFRSNRGKAVRGHTAVTQSSQSPRCLSKLLMNIHHVLYADAKAGLRCRRRSRRCWALDPLTGRPCAAATDLMCTPARRQRLDRILPQTCASEHHSMSIHCVRVRTLRPSRQRAQCTCCIVNLPSMLSSTLFGLALLLPPVSSSAGIAIPAAHHGCMAC